MKMTCLVIVVQNGGFRGCTRCGGNNTLSNCGLCDENDGSRSQCGENEGFVLLMLML